MDEIIPIARIENKILTIRDQKIMIDYDLAELYGVETKALNQAVKRNIKRFPEDFMFQLTKEEKTEVVTICDHLASLKYSYRLPYAFTENGVAMLSSVLNSEKAIQVNIQIMRAFNFLKKKYLEDREIDKKIDLLAQKHDQDVTFIFMELDRLDRLIESGTSKKQIGFTKED
jgi:phage regulator Rha-like protein